jgi:hypothetical protein
MHLRCTDQLLWLSSLSVLHLGDRRQSQVQP